MNAMIRTLKGILAVVALAAVGVLLRWMTAGAISGLRTYDLDSLTVAAVGTIAWIAYAWLTLAVLLTVLEQIPGVIGDLAGAVAGRITTKTARALLRSGLGVAAITPLTVSAAHATPATTHVRQAPEPPSTLQLGNTTAPHKPTADHNTFRATEPPSTVRITSPGTASQNPTARDFRATEPASTVQLGGPAHDLRRTSAENVAPQQHIDNRRTANPNSTNSTETGANQATPQTPATNRTDFRATEPGSTVQISGSEAAPGQAAGGHGAFRATEPPSTVKLGGTATPPQKSGETAGSDRPSTDRPQVDVPEQPTGERARTDVPEQPAGGRARAGVPDRPADGRGDGPERPGGGRVGVPDRPTDGAPTRYTELRPGVPVRVVVREGDSLWSIAARELGPAATNEAVAARWPDWYTVNRQVIGDDPDLIVPGQVLRIPPAPNGDHLPPLHQEP